MVIHQIRIQWIEAENRWQFDSDVLKREDANEEEHDLARLLEESSIAILKAAFNQEDTNVNYIAGTKPMVSDLGTIDP